jgi:signal transduction histidine kinase
MYRAKKHGIGSFVFHGGNSMSERTLQLPALVMPTLQVQSAPALTEHERRHAQLQEANQRLILAAINSQEQQDAAEQAQRRQTQFLATVANALRDPLEPLRVATATLGRLRGNESLQPQVQAMIELQVGNMSRLVDKLVSLTRVNAARMTLESRVVAMGPIVDAAIKACRPAMELRLQQLEVLLPEDSLEVQGDPVRLVQVLNNLLSNASKYTPNGGRIELQLMAADDTVVITVCDSGIGITAEALPTIFASFAKHPHANDFAGIASGPGLREVRELVEAHGGTVVASSEGRERGSQFTVTLPLAIHRTRH